MNGLELTNRALDLWVANRGGDSTKGQCQRFDGYYWQWAWQGNDSIVTYGSAKLAGDASAMFVTDSVNNGAITPGDLLYWHYVDGNGNNYGHVCTAVGRDGGRLLVSNTASTGDTFQGQTLRNGVKISHADTINLTFRGASHTNGKNARRTDVTAWPAAALGPTQRQVLPAPVEARRRQGKPSTSAPQGDPLPSNTIGDFAGWVYGENVNGNNLWYVGAYGDHDFFWSGSFTEVSTHDLPDLNAPAIAGNQRQVLSSGTARQRSEPKTSSPTVSELAANAIATFDGWITGESVSGNAVWIREQGSGLFSWSGGFTDTGTHDLADLNAAPPVKQTRTVGSATANVRGYPTTSQPVVGTLPAGTSLEVAQYAIGEKVSGIDVWYVVPSGWAWTGGFTSQSLDGLEKIPAPTPDPPVTDPNNPRGLQTYAPVLPLAFEGLIAPLGFKGGDFSKPQTRDTKGSPAVPVSPMLIDRYIIHHTATTADQLDYFSYMNDRSSCPTWYMRTDGSLIELIRPKLKPAASGPSWNYRSLATETLNATGSPTWTVTDAQLEAHAQIVAWIAEFDGKTLDEIPVSFKIDREHVIGHNETGFATACPGPYLSPRLDDIVARAQQIWDERHPTPPDPTPEGVVVTEAFVKGQIVAAEAAAANWKSLIE